MRWLSRLLRKPQYGTMSVHHIRRACAPLKASENAMLVVAAGLATH